MKNKGFLIAMIIFGTPFLVISLSTFWYYAGLGPKATVNYGTMINPPVDLGSLELELDYQPLNIDSMERKWMIIHLSLIHISDPRDPKTSRMPSSA